MTLALAYPQVGHEANIGGGYNPGGDFIVSSGGFDVPEALAKIAQCESRDRHFEADGKVLRGEHNPADIGRYQINIKYWEKKAKELGYDIYTEAGNEAMALHLYREYGTAPWKRSQPCWQN